MDLGNIFDRLSQGPGNMQRSDYDNWNEMVGSAPPDKFGRSVYDAVKQVDPNEYGRHVQPGADNTDPLGALAPQDRSGLAQTVLSELMRRGLNPNDIGRQTGIGGLNPNNMSPNDLAGLLQWTQQNEPKAFGRVAAQYQDKPDILQSLLGNKVLMTALGAIGAKLFSDRMSRQ